MYRKLLSSKEIIQICYTLKAVMGMQDQAFKSCTKRIQS